MEKENRLTARTKDGLPVNITCAFQYQLIDSLDSIVDLYNKWGTEDYERTFLRVARGALREAVAGFAGMAVVTGRSAVEAAMWSRLLSVLEVSQVEVRNFQLGEIELPEEFMKSIYDLERYKQEYTTALYKLEAVRNQGAGAVAKATEETDSIENEARGYATRMGYVRVM